MLGFKRVLLLLGTVSHLAGVPVLCLCLGLHELVCLFHFAHVRLRETRYNIMKLEAKQLQPATNVWKHAHTNVHVKNAFREKSLT